MISKRLRARVALGLALVALGASAPAPVALGGPIADMLARHRSQRQMQLPPMEKPFTGKAIKDISPSSLSSRFKKRFALKKPGDVSSGGLFSTSRDSGVIKASR